MRNWILILCLVCAGSVFAGQHYISSSGSDAADGATPATAWGTITTKFNNYTIPDGDTINLIAGSVWWNTRMNPKNGGTTKQILIRNYGEGALPVISAGIKLAGPTYEWRLSAHGTNEYYVVLAGGGTPSIAARPIPIWIDGEALDTAKVGELLDHQYQYADNDGLGFSTVYLRDNSGDPDVSGVIIVMPSQTNALYCTKSKINFKGISFCNGTGDAARIYGAVGDTLDSLDFYESYKGISVESSSNNVLFKTCKIRKIFASTYQGAYIQTSSTNITFVNCLFYDIQGYGLLINAPGPVNVNNCDFLKIRLNAIKNNSATSTTNVYYNIFTATGYSGTNPVLNSAAGTINVKGNCALDGFTLDLNIYSGCTDQGGNVNDYPRFVKDPKVGFLYPRQDDYVSSGNYDIYKTYTDSLTKYAPGANMSWFLSRTDMITTNEWSPIKNLSDAGWDIGGHTRGHIEVTPDSAFNIRYVGSGTSCQLNITVDTLNRTARVWTVCDVPADQFDYSCAITDGNNYRIGSETDAGIIKTINDLPAYTCASIQQFYYYAKTFCIKPIANQDIKTAAWKAPLDLGVFYHEELELCAQDVTSHLNKSSITFAYPSTNLKRDSAIAYMTNRVPNVILSGSTVSATSGTLMKYISLYDMSCKGATEVQAATHADRMLKAKSLAALMSFWGGAMAVLTHGFDGWKPDSLALFAKAVQDMGGRCRMGSQMDATQFIRTNGEQLNYKMWRCFQPDSGDFRLKSTSPAKNKGDKTALAGIPNVYTLDGVQLTDGSGTVIVDSVNIGAYGTYNSIPQYTLSITSTNGTVTQSPLGSPLDSNTTVTLTPVPASGYTFSSWSGDLTGNQNPATVVMEGNKAIAANFKLSIKSDNSKGAFKPAFLAAFRRAFR